LTREYAASQSTRLSATLAGPRPASETINYASLKEAIYGLPALCDCQRKRLKPIVGRRSFWKLCSPEIGQAVSVLIAQRGFSYALLGIELLWGIGARIA